MLQRKVFTQERLPQFENNVVPEFIRRQREAWSPFCGFSKIITVGKSKGEETISRSDFFDEVDSDWVNYGFGAPSGIPTKKPNRVVILTQRKDGSLPDLVKVISNIERRVLRQEHMDSFCRKYPDLIPETTSIFFPVVQGEVVKPDLSNVYFGNAFRKNGKILSNIRKPHDDTVFLAEDGERKIVIFHS